MKILHVITSLRTGGAEKLMVDLLPRLKQKRLDVDLLLFDGTDTPFRRAAEEAGVKVYDLGIGGSVYSPMRLLKLIPFLRKYDVVHTHNTAPQLFAAIGSLLNPVSLCTTEHNTSNRRRGWGWYAAIDRWMYNRYSKVICISKKAETNLKDFIGKTRSAVCTINNGIDIAKYSNAQPINIKGADCNVALIQVAGFRYQKDQDTVIKALQYLPAQYHLFLVGDGDRRGEIESLISKLNLTQRVHLLGIRSDVARLLKASDIVIMSSHWEGFGLAAVEGMAAGKPVIASDVEGMREVVSGAGIIFSHADARALASAILKLVTSPDFRQSIVNACVARASEFDISKMADAYAGIYNDLSQATR